MTTTTQHDPERMVARTLEDEANELLMFDDNTGLWDEYKLYETYYNMAQHLDVVEEVSEQLHDENSSDGYEDDAVYINNNSFGIETATTTSIVRRSKIDKHNSGTDSMAKYKNNVAKHGNSTTLPTLTYRPSNVLFLSCDYRIMTPYQCFIRQQIELFETTSILDESISSNAVSPPNMALFHTTAIAPAIIQGRNKPIILGQVGVRCKYCFRPMAKGPTIATRASMYYPSKLDGIYQAANNIANIHYLQNYCKNIPEAALKTMKQLKEQPCGSVAIPDHQTSTSSIISINRNNVVYNNTVTKGAGKELWAQRAAILGVFEDTTNNILRYYPTMMYVYDQEHSRGDNNSNTKNTVKRQSKQLFKSSSKLRIL